MASDFVPEQVYPEQALALVGPRDPYVQPADDQVFGVLRATVNLQVTIIAPNAVNQESTYEIDALAMTALKALCVDHDWTFVSFEGPGLYEGTAFPAMNLNISNRMEVN
jgi:hypothetical protein